LRYRQRYPNRREHPQCPTQPKQAPSKHPHFGKLGHVSSSLTADKQQKNNTNNQTRVSQTNSVGTCNHHQVGGNSGWTAATANRRFMPTELRSRKAAELVKSSAHLRASTYFDTNP
jgi:hypothetical protein